jgi:hypothetical protein
MQGDSFLLFRMAFGYHQLGRADIGVNSHSRLSDYFDAVEKAGTFTVHHMTLRPTRYHYGDESGKKVTAHHNKQAI